jgi:hypothetical protein
MKRRFPMKVLLLDTAFAATPIYESLIHLGCDVWVMGNRSQDVLARKAGPKWIQQDYSFVDQVAHHVVEKGIDAVVPGCTDVSIETCLQVAPPAQDVDRLDANRILSNKASFRGLCADLDLPAPRAIAADKFPQTGLFICKPVDSFSGRGITVFDGGDQAALKAAWDIARNSSPSRSIVIEQFIPGQLYSCSAFVKNKRVMRAFYVIEGSSANAYAVDTSYVVYDLPVQALQQIERSLERIATELHLRDGLIHMQFILYETSVYIIEVSRRCPGDLYPLLIEYSKYYPYSHTYVSYFMGLDPVADAESGASPIRKRYVLRHTVSSLTDSIFEGLQFVESQPVISFFPLQPVGQELLGNQKTRAGVLFCEIPNYDALRAKYNAFLSRTLYCT